MSGAAEYNGAWRQPLKQKRNLINDDGNEYEWKNAIVRGGPWAIWS